MTRTKREPLTPRQRQLYEFMLRHVEAFGTQATRKDCARRMGVTSIFTITRLVEILERKGWVRRRYDAFDSGRAGNLEFIGVKFKAIREK